MLKFNIDRKRIREIRANQSKLESASCKRKRLDMQGELKGNRTSSNNHGKHWVGTDGNDQA